MRKEIIGLLVWFLFALYVAIASYRLDLGTWGAPDAGYVPFGAALLLALISLLLLIKALSQAGRREEEASVLQERLHGRDLSLTFIGMILYIFLINGLGFVLCTFLLMVFLIGAVGKMSWFVSLTAALAITAVSYLLFEILLDAQLPKGIMEMIF